MALRGLREKVVYAHNPLPAVTDRELLDRAGLDIVDGPDKTQLFTWIWVYDVGENYERVKLAPGDFVAMRENEGRAFLTRLAEQGGVVIEDPDDPAEVKAAKLKGLAAARGFWVDRGTKLARDYRKRHGIGQEELEEMKFDLWPFYRNQVAADVCEEEMKRLRTGGDVETPRSRRKPKAAAAS